MMIGKLDFSLKGAYMNKFDGTEFFETTEEFNSIKKLF